MENKSTKILMVIVAILVIATGVLFAVKIIREKNNGSDEVISLGTEKLGKGKKENNKEEKSITTFSGTDRPIAVMIDNHKSAMPQSGLNDAYIVYEMIVEGGETRLMALFKGKTLDKIGPIRSSRHYFLDYALENDAIYVHYGWSPQAQSDITKLGVNNVNGLVESTSDFWRAKDKSAPHNAVSATKNILSIAEAKGYNLKSDKKSVLNYVAEDVNLESEQVANKFSIKYSDYNTVSYTYDSEAKKYLRYSRKTKQIDWDTKEEVFAKNIIITFVKNTTLNDGENKGRQTLDNIGTRDGYYITNGKAIKIKCEKKSRKEQTVYKDMQGNEIKVNDGNTFIQICPIDAKVSFE
ncbi:MAG TPA: DUF3048 domain-containing protein [Clostridiales bacterium]|nr:DUF3048 domain-containing protein [Clostridiales bacterium]